MVSLQLQADSPFGSDEADDDDDVFIQPWTNILPVHKHVPDKKSFKNPRNVPSDSCPRDEDLAQAQVGYHIIITIRFYAVQWYLYDDE